jgi:hypothetical protein
MTTDRTRDGDWDRSEWKGEPDADTDRTAATTPADAATGDRWTKTQWPGDQGAGSPEPVDPDAMPEGEPGLSGDRHAPGESHWARGQAAEDVP